ncbi:hypothetical protein O6H91_16G031100 [Diphasiastrum complanatum]|uniref:Uncharacterized protein n=1 Tax=Diphasiastrum complanatum TaxID=34168 RepID=A0ACC2BBA7_DIPCM|nr:hypothetical protein O6H91_16G031100 [Diphasiastrum complanatum]
MIHRHRCPADPSPSLPHSLSPAMAQPPPLNMDSSYVENKSRTFPMDVSSAGADKLRLTVKEKLQEFMESYTDDVLAEYVVVLVGHGKQKAQTTADLEAFLGNQSEAFVSWLWDHLSAHKDLYVSTSQHRNGRCKDVTEREHHSRKRQANAVSTALEQDKAFCAVIKELPRLSQKESSQICTNWPKKNLGKHASSSGRDEATYSYEGQGYNGHENKGKEHYNQNREAKRRRSPELLCRRTKDRLLEKIPRKKQSSLSHVRASRRLLESAVREAVAPAVSFLQRESTLKRIRSVISAETDYAGVLLEPAGSRHPLKSQITLSRQDASLCSAMVVTGKAATAAAENVNSFKQSRAKPMNNVWDRLGKTSNQSQWVQKEAIEGICKKEQSFQDYQQGRLADGESLTVEEGMVSDEIEERLLSDGHDWTDAANTFKGEEAVTLDEEFVPAEGMAMILDEVGITSAKGCCLANKCLGGAMLSDVIKKEHIKDKAGLNESVNIEYIKGSSDSETDRINAPGFSLNGSQESAHEFLMLTDVDVNPLKDSSNCEMGSLYSCSSDNVQRESGLPKAQNVDFTPEIDVSEIKRRMHQVEVEMTKLRARQVEVSKKVQKITAAPVSGAKPSGPSQSSEDHVDGHSVFVTNVHFAATKDALSVHFANCGDISRVTMLTDEVTGKPKGSAIVEFTSKEGVEKALNLNDSNFLSRPLKVVRKDQTSLELSSVARPSLIPTLHIPVQNVARGSTFGQPSLAPRRPLRLFRSFPATHHLQWKRESCSPGAVNTIQAAANHLDGLSIRPACPPDHTLSMNAFISPMRLKRSLSYVRSAQDSPSEAPNIVHEQKAGYLRRAEEILLADDPAL